MAGRHRAPRKHRWARAIAIELAVAAAVVAAVLGSVSDDARVLRAAVFGALAAAFIGAVLPRRQRPVADFSAELRRLRAQVAELRTQLDTLAASGQLAASVRSATLQLPLIRAALATPAVNGHANGQANGHAVGHRIIDLTTQPIPAEHS